jgi:RND family efflux transporter MFP subunit
MTGAFAVPLRPGCNLTLEFPSMRTKFLRARSTLPALIVTVIAIVVVAAGILSRNSQAKKLKAEADTRSIPTVSVLSPSGAAAATLELPARIEPWARAPIYARVGGYLESWKVDIGAPVKAGQLLATIQTPDLDQQALQAKAELATAGSNVVLAESTAARWQTLMSADAVSRQEADEKVGDLAAKRSQVRALQANVQRVQELQRYTRLVAPFDGVVTARNTDVGALINAGGAAGSELFVVSDIRRLRVYVNVPQRQVAMILPGSTAQLSVPERAGRTYPATVQSLSQAINAGSGAMLVQLAVGNEAGELLPGASGTVSFDMPAGADGISVPPGALILGKNGVQVATVDSASRVRLNPVKVTRDLGNVVLLAGAITRSDRVIDSPPDGIATGDLVRIAAVKAAP